MSEEKFWEKLSLAQMNQQQWESLCDHCARCCLYKLEDEDSGDIHYTRVVCELLDMENCHCTNYENRKQLVPDCVKLTKRNVQQLSWLPSTCAYRLLRDGKPLAPWHPLVSGDANSVHQAGVSVGRWAVKETKDTDMDELEANIIDWIHS